MRFTFPDDPFTYGVQPLANTPLTSMAGKTVTVYGDSACTTLADIQTPQGVTIPNSVLTIDGNSEIPEFLGPDDVTELYVRVGTGSMVIHPRSSDSGMSVFVSPDAPSAAGPYLWVQTGLPNNGLTFWVEDGA